MEKIIRTICVFSNEASDDEIKKLEKISQLLQETGFLVQTKRICISDAKMQVNQSTLSEKKIFFGIGKQSLRMFKENFEDFLQSEIKSTSLDLTDDTITEEHVNFLFKIIQNNPDATFRFTYGFNLPSSSPYFPAANFEKPGFTIGLQPTNLSADCKTLTQWLEILKNTWQEIHMLLRSVDGYLGIDSSIAPLFRDSGSLVHFIKKLGMDFSHSTTTDVYTKISKFIKEHNPRPVGLCGLMFACLEDFELSEEYEKGNFPIERNIFLSLHSGVGIDVYPIAVNQDKTRVIEILRLLQHLSNKYKKPLSARFVSDGVAKIGEKTNFQNPYLRDVIVRPL